MYLKMTPVFEDPAFRKMVNFVKECITVIYLTTSFENIDYFKIAKILRL